MKRFWLFIMIACFVVQTTIQAQSKLVNGDFEIPNAQGWDISFSHWGSGDKLATWSVFAADDNIPNTTQKLSLFNGTEQDIDFVVRQRVVLEPGDYVASLIYEGGEDGNNIQGSLSVHGESVGFGRLSGWKFWKTAELDTISVLETTEVVLEVTGTLEQEVWLSLDDIELVKKSDYVAKDFSTVKPSVSTFGSIELATNSIIDTADVTNSIFFTEYKYWDAEVNFGFESSTFGGLLALSTDGSGSKYNVSLRDTHAWVKISDVAKITMGDFTTNGTYGLTELIDVYDLGILQYKVFPTWQGINALSSDELGNLLADFYVGPATLSFSWLKPYSLAATSPQLNFGARASGKVHENIHLNLTAVYDDTDTKIENNSTVKIGTFASFNAILDTYNFLLGYTIHAIDSQSGLGFEHGIDMRAEAFLPFITLATHNNFSYYGENELVLYNEIKAEYPFYEKLIGALSLQSSYYNNGFDASKNVYNLNVFFDLDYKVNQWATLTTGVYAFGIGNTSGLYDVFGQGTRTDGVIIGIPLKILVEF